MIVLYWNGLDSHPAFHRVPADRAKRLFMLGDARATLTPPMHVRVVEVFTENVEGHLAPGEIYMSLFGDAVEDYTIYLDDTLQSLALSAHVKEKPKAFAARLRRSLNQAS